MQQFKARPKPEYKFFQPKLAAKQEISFAPFELSTTKRMESRKKSVNEEKFEFRARKVPDFSKVNSSVVGLQSIVPPKQLTKFAEFNLSGDIRKSIKPAEEFPAPIVFKATPVKAKLSENVEVTVKSSKQLTIPCDVLLSSS